MEMTGIILWWAAWGISLCCLAVHDARTHTIRNEGCLLVLLLGILWHRRDLACLTACLGTAAIVLALGVLIFRLTNGKGLGGGDVKLAAAAAVRLGGTGILMALLLGLLPALAAAAVFRKRGRDRIPLGPFLSAGILLCTIWQPF